MKRLVQFGLILCSAIPSWASIARSAAGSGSTSAIPSSSAPFQYEIGFAVESGATTAIANPSGWYSITAKSSASSYMRVTARTEYNSTAAASGTFTNASSVGVVGYTGTNARALQDSNVSGLAALGVYATVATGTSSSASCPSLGALHNTGGGAWVLCGIYNAGGTADNCASPPSGMTAVSAATSGYLQVFDTNGGVSSFPGATCTLGASVVWIGETVEIDPPPVSPHALSQLINSDSGGAAGVGYAPATSQFFYYVDPTLPGNAYFFPMTYGTGSITSVAVTDDKGDTASKIVACNDSTTGMTVALYEIPSLSSGATKLTVSLNANETNSFMMGRIQMKNIGAQDGTASCTTGLSPSSSATGNLADPTGVITTSSGDLILNFAVDYGTGGGPGLGSNNTIDDIVPGSGFSGIWEDASWGSSAIAEIQSSPGLVKPSQTYVFDLYEDIFGMVTAAFKINTSNGTSRKPGMIIRQSQATVPGADAASQNLTFPCDAGNFVMMTYECSNGSGETGCSNITSQVDTERNSWSSLVPGGLNIGYPQYWYTTNAVCSGQNFIYMTKATGAADETRVTFYEVPNVATSSPIDIGSEAYSGEVNVVDQTTLSAAVTSATQTTLSLASTGTIANGDFLMVGAEIVQVVSGAGTTSITVARGENGPALPSIASGTPVYESLITSVPSAVTSQNNELLFCSMNQGTGPNWHSYDATYDFGSFQGQNDSQAFTNGDGNCHVYVPTAGTTNVGYYVDNGAQANGAMGSTVAVRLQSLGTTRRRAQVNQ